MSEKVTIETNRVFAEIDWRKIVMEKENNPREDMGDIKELANEIRAVGRILVPLLVHEADSDGNHLLEHGNRRMVALTKLEDDGFKIATVPVEIVPETFDRRQALINHLIQNNGKPLSSLEQGNVFKLLEEMGLARKEIAEATGRTQSHIGNMLSLVESFGKPVKDAINSNKISATRALEILKESKNAEKATGIILLAVEGAAKAGKPKATKQGGKRKPKTPKSTKGRHTYNKVSEGVTKPEKKQLALFFHDCHEFINSPSALDRRMVDEILEVDEKGIYHVRIVDFVKLRERLEKELKDSDKD